MMLQAQQTAPHFKSVNQDQHTVQLSDFIGKQHVVLYFYPKDDTPGCTIEANDFSTLSPAFNEANAVVIGVSKDNCASHQAFINKFNLQLHLLADTDGSVCAAYDVWQEKEKNGEKKMGIVRSTFLINKNGVLEAALYGVSPEGHAADMLARVKALGV
ncbi:peroxiredoxin [Thiomicrorhabdus aquaedulcis]|uniref:peroxiredoxin n=1 Tax=Thiomicrorhabdus aquaedulcis TaxID=2211106 RepID=UPI001E47360E|nr:peroxiredoxin [Thiomicrorhabdus aquaedulcis]